MRATQCHPVAAAVAAECRGVVLVGAVKDMERMPELKLMSGAATLYVCRTDLRFFLLQQQQQQQQCVCVGGGTHALVCCCQPAGVACEAL